MEGQGNGTPQPATPTPQPPGHEIDWGPVILAAALLVLAVALIPNVILRTGIALVVFLWAFRLSRPRTPDPALETPLLAKLQQGSQGLDRRRYGRLRAYTDSMLDEVREINRLAIDAREGKMTQRHANAQLDRKVTDMRGVLDQIRRSAGVPTLAVDTLGH